CPRVNCTSECRRVVFFFSSRRRHTRWPRDWSSDVCSSDLHNDGSRRNLPGSHQASVQRVHQQQLPQPSPTECAAHRKTTDQGCRSEERRVGKSVDLGGRRIIKKRKNKLNHALLRIINTQIM